MDRIPEKYTNWKIGDRYRLARIHNMDAYLKAIPDIRNKRVLDLGCGRGDGIMLMSFFAENIVGVDNHPKAISRALSQDYFCTAKIGKVDLNTIVPKTKFDVVTAFEVLEHLENPEKVIRDTNWQTFLFTVPYNQPHDLHTFVFKSMEDVKEIVPWDIVKKADLEYIKDEIYFVKLWRK